MIMTTYYWENQVGFSPEHGIIKAENDQEAITKLPQSALCMYKESDSEYGLPFIMVHERETIEEV